MEGEGRDAVADWDGGGESCCNAGGRLRCCEGESWRRSETFMLREIKKEEEEGEEASEEEESVRR